MKSILEHTQDYVLAYFDRKMPSDLCFHSLDHTLEVVNAAQVLGKKSGLKTDDQEILNVAAWFHDTGYAKSYAGHEADSKALADMFLTQQHYQEERKQQVLDLILKDTAVASQQLHDLMQDADLSNLGGEHFFRNGALLRKELERYQDLTIDDLSWEKRQYDFLLNNPFKTKAALDMYERGYHQNLLKQQERVLDLQ